MTLQAELTAEATTSRTAWEQKWHPKRQGVRWKGGALLGPVLACSPVGPLLAGNLEDRWHEGGPCPSFARLAAAACTLDQSGVPGFSPICSWLVTHGESLPQKISLSLALGSAAGCGEVCVCGGGGGARPF